MADLPDIPRAEAAIVDRTNVFRQTEGLGTVRRDPALDRAAKAFARYLARTGRFSHEADGRKPADRAQAAGYWFCTIAENLALNLDSRGFTVEKLARETMEGWKNSPGHRRNLELPSVTEIGVGIAQAEGEPKFLSVQLLGRPRRLAYEFKVVNTSRVAVSYSFAGQDYDLPARATVTHKACEPGGIHFKSAGGWLGGKRIDARYQAADKARYEVHVDAGGKLRVEASR
ncbi:MAG: CAP domain-containing protein [Hyphomicrobiaceae bacterium]